MKPRSVMEAMRGENRSGATRSGFALAAVLLIVGAMLVLAVGLLLVTGIERGTARSFVDRQRADLAVRAGLEEVKALLSKEAANDDYLVIQGTVPLAEGSKKEALPYLYIARGSGGGDNVRYRYIPLFSTNTKPSGGGDGLPLKAPDPKLLTEGETKGFTTLPWYEEAEVPWLEIRDDRSKLVSRYAYWVEDLEARIHPKLAGNEEGDQGVHGRTSYPDPASKPVSANLPPASAIALFALDPESDDSPARHLTHEVIAARSAMISPESVLGAMGFKAPLARGSETGLLADPVAASLERNVSPVIQAYREQPVVPYSAGISADVSGKPKLNLNTLLGASRAGAIDDFAGWVRKALPDFDGRKGGFPATEDYLKTLAANAFDYADADREPSVSRGSYRGLDGQPHLSELVLKIEYLDHFAKDGRLYLRWRFRLFGELWNMTQQPVNGRASLSYEVALNHSAIGAGVRGRPFDDPDLLNDPERSQHDLVFRDGRFFGPEVDINLPADGYAFYRFAEVICSVDVGSNSISWNTPFTLEERPSEGRGVSMMWNGVETERIDRIVRDPGDPKKKEMEFVILHPKTVSKSAIPGMSYGFYGDFRNNMGDPRISHYLREQPLSENSSLNLSPFRRNIRRTTIYNSDSSEKRRHYGRVLPSEWPDGGHNSPVGSFSPPADIALAIEPDSPVYQKSAPPFARENAPTRISNEGRFHSAVELGHVYDPVMWSPAYRDLPGDPGSGARDTRLLNLPQSKGFATMPASRNSWPEVTSSSVESSEYGGGNTLRIGRPEHQRFNRPGQHAAHLLDLFHAGDAEPPWGEGPESETVKIEGRVNVNTAGKDVLRSLAAGMLRQDKELRKVTKWAHETSSGRFSPASERIELGTPTAEKAADLIAEGILQSRPFSSVRELAQARIKGEAGDDADQPVFGNKLLYTDADRIQWTDAAAEEVFTRVHDAATLRSRNFRVWVIGQSVVKSGSTTEVLAENRKSFVIFADPGERNPNGSIRASALKVKTMYENEF